MFGFNAERADTPAEGITLRLIVEDRAGNVISDESHVAGQQPERKALPQPVRWDDPRIREAVEEVVLAGHVVRTGS